MRVLSPIPTGSGAYVLHEQLASRLADYRLRPYSPWWTLFPPALPLAGRGNADLVHAEAGYGIFFKRRGLPLVVTAHGYVSDRLMRACSSRLQYLHYRTDLRLFTYLTLQQADRVVVVSEFLRNLIRRDLGIDRPVQVIHNGVNEQRFVPAPPAHAAKRKSFRLLFCGNLRPAKGAGLLVPLAEALGEGFEICYTGGSSDAKASQAPSPRGAGRLVPLGRLAHADMPAVYHDVDALLVPSLREGFGLCVAEAMACGLPVVATNDSALPELVQHGDGGLLCPANDVVAFANAVRMLAGSRADRVRMGEYNRARVEEHFTLDRMAEDYRRLFIEVIDGGAAG